MIQTARFVRIDRIRRPKHYFIKKSAGAWRKNTGEEITSIRRVAQKDIKSRKKNMRAGWRRKSICDRSPATVRRYLGILTATGVVAAEGNTNNSIYKVVKK